MPNTDLSDETIREEVRLSLGGSSVDVELSDADIKGCSKKALREYARVLPYKGRYAMQASANQQKVRVDELIPNLIGVSDVQFIDRRVEPADVDPFDPYVTSLTGPNYGDETFADVEQRLGFAEDAQRIISAEPEWLFQWEKVQVTAGNWENHAYLYLSVLRAPTTAGLEFTANYVADDNHPSGWGAVPATDVDWIIEFTVAYAKTILSRIRGKFAGITNPEGSTDQVDYVELAQEGKEEMDRLREELQKRRPPFAPITA